MSSGIKNVGNDSSFTPFGKNVSPSSNAQGGSDGAPGMERGQSAGGLRPITRVTLSGDGDASADVKNVGNVNPPFKPKF